MEAQELRQFKKDELETKIRQWREELFRSRFKSQTSEAKDTSVFPKLRRDIARGLTVLHEGTLGIVRAAKTAEVSPKGSAGPAPKKTTKKTATKKASAKAQQ